MITIRIREDSAIGTLMMYSEKRAIGKRKNKNDKTEYIEKRIGKNIIPVLDSRSSCD